MSSTDASRRQLLLGILAGCAAGAAHFTQHADSFITRVRHLLARTSLPMAPEHTLARAIVFGDAPVDVAGGRLSDAELRRRIRENIRADYGRGRIVSRAGWQISATEADALDLMRRMQLT